MSDHESSSRDGAADRPADPAPDDESTLRDPQEPDVSTSWRTITAPWGTPGNHLTGPIPRIRRRPDGSLTHGEES
ncbi:hypothetical protein [Mobilicoccus caccae]|uniref:Uncharacterized protein n=1 Tax=Mobilicoccus caccae TaxID=1859295 RepID=A0ABQ6ITT6_9MICO|nr:hypothetical protein [Mobilicoccus caccae]GMA41345.1 hypothetical protein GCM10025883_33900 [Mobilicoccus caccae]